jgi:hypothetical protein
MKLMKDLGGKVNEDKQNRVRNIGRSEENGGVILH